MSRINKHLDSQILNFATLKDPLNASPCDICCSILKYGLFVLFFTSEKSLENCSNLPRIIMLNLKDNKGVSRLFFFYLIMI